MCSVCDEWNWRHVERVRVHAICTEEVEYNFMSISILWATTFMHKTLLNRNEHFNYSLRNFVIDVTITHTGVIFNRIQFLML